mmetsp:Transcript_8374/g.28490  ORF Transcript_8374/g.28490 Transcript_8374/m.28490 type:complete len:215 (-) Transcript_8374:768-1412(-)
MGPRRERALAAGRCARASVEASTHPQRSPSPRARGAARASHLAASRPHSTMLAWPGLLISRSAWRRTSRVGCVLASWRHCAASLLSGEGLCLPRGAGRARGAAPLLIIMCAMDMPMLLVRRSSCSRARREILVSAEASASEPYASAASRSASSSAARLAPRRRAWATAWAPMPVAQSARPTPVSASADVSEPRPLPPRGGGGARMASSRALRRI